MDNLNHDDENRGNGSETDEEREVVDTTNH